MTSDECPHRADEAKAPAASRLTDSRTSGPAGRKMMNASKASASAERLEIARRLYNALVAQDPNRVIILIDGGGRMVARHDLRPEQAGVAEQ
jgi:hypothetical protein